MEESMLTSCCILDTGHLGLRCTRPDNLTFFHRAGQVLQGEHLDLELVFEGLLRLSHTGEAGSELSEHAADGRVSENEEYVCPGCCSQRRSTQVTLLIQMIDRRKLKLSDGRSESLDVTWVMVR